MKREAGYYWVWINGYQSIAENDNNWWFILGKYMPYRESDFEEIGPKIEPPKEKITKDQFVSKLMKGKE